jgi:hypothetical protein
VAETPEKCILADDPGLCTETPASGSKCFPVSCNFFVPFAQKDARFGGAQITGDRPAEIERMKA